jgi:hypothetical protein
MSELPPFDQDLTLPNDHDKNHESSDFATQLSSPTQFMPPQPDETKATPAPSTLFETQIAKSEPTIGYIQRPPTMEVSRPNGRITLAAIGFIVLALFALALFLPPISILDRLNDNNRTLTSGNFAPLTTGKPQSFRGLTLGVTQAGHSDDFELRVRSVSAEDYERNRFSGSNCESAALLPTYINPIGNVYSIETQGYPPDELQLRLDIDELTGEDVASNQVDWYGFDPALSRWRFLPTQLNSDQNFIQTTVQRLPACLLTTSVAPSIPIIGTAIDSQHAFPAAADSTRVLYPRGLHPVSNGSVLGVLSSGIDTQNRYRVIPVISNAINANVTDVQTIETLLSDPIRRAEHVTQLINLALSDDYAGIAIDYRHLPDTPEMREQFSLFLLDLRRGLQSQQRVLVVVLSLPTQQEGIWQTGPYDWARIGQIADEILLQAPLDPQSFAENGQLHMALAWITTQVSRHQLFLEISAANVQSTSDGYTLPLEDAMSSLAFSGQLELNPPSDTYAAGDTITAELSSSARLQPSWDAPTHTIAIRQLQNEIPTRIQWITTPQTLQFRIQVASRYGLGGVVIDDLFTGDDGSELLTTLNNLPDDNSTQSPANPSATLFWTVTDLEGNILSSVASDTLTYTIAEDETVLEITAQLLINDQPIPIARQTIDLSATTVAAVPDNETTPPVNDETSATDNSSDETTESSTPDDRDTDTITDDNTSPPPSTDEDTPSPPTTDDTDDDTTDDGTDDSSTTPPPTTSLDFQLGGQIENFSDKSLDVLSQTHMTWIRWQVPYNSGASPDLVAPRITAAHDAGYKILISIAGQPAALNDPNFNQSFSAYVGRLSELGADAIEIWAAPNSSTYWLAGQIDPTLYVALLSDASAAIRNANPETIIISAALQPSVAVQGDGQSDTLWNDDVYRAAMAQAGAAEYIDCIGVRYIQGTVPPDATSGDQRGDAPIYYLPSLIDRAYAAFDRTLPICFTSFGYLSGDGYGQLPINLSWANETTSQNQADWLAQAVTLNADSDTIYLMIIWNIDFKFSTDRSEGYALIRGDDSCPACVTLGALSP